MTPAYSALDHLALLPVLLLALFGCGLLILEFLVSDDAKGRLVLAAGAAAGILFSAAGLWRQHQFLLANGLAGFQGMQDSVTIDRFSIYFNAVFLAASLLVCLASSRYLESEAEHSGEYYSLLLFANCGMYFLATGTDLITLFLGLELMALSFYVLVGFLRGATRSNEAAIKYFLMGALSSGLLAYGFSLLYGISGSTLLPDIRAAASGYAAGSPLLFLAIATITAGLLFKIAAVPFHMWAPDTYEGAPTTVAAYLSVASKAAAFAFLLRIYLDTLAGARGFWEPLLVVAAVASLTVGNFAAMTQKNIKRMLAYSSISHGGYILLGLVAGNATGIQGIAVYLLIYVFMNLGAFLVIVSLRRSQIIGDDLDDFAGLMHKSPVHASLMLVFLVSLGGIPPAAGFLGKYFIFLSLIETGHYVLAVIATLYVGISVYYYFRIVKSMFTAKEVDSVPLLPDYGLRVALGVSAALTLAIGIYPEPVLQFARTSLLR